MATDLLKMLDLSKSPVVETVYNGYRFKKRLEARWAVFFDTLSISYRYEYEEFNLGDDIIFAPSFYLPTLNSWVHILDSEPNAVDDLKANVLALATQQNVYIFFGDCWRPDDLLRQGNQSGYGYIPRMMEYGHDVFFEDKCWWCECKTCNTFGIAPSGRTDLLPCKHETSETTNITSFKLITAYMKARQARFGAANTMTIRLAENTTNTSPVSTKTTKLSESFTEDNSTVMQNNSEQPYQELLVKEEEEKIYQLTQPTLVLVDNSISS